MDIKSTPTKPASALTPAEPDIAVRAYEIFLSRGASHGHDLDDWLQAERELTFAVSGEETKKARAVGA